METGRIVGISNHGEVIRYIIKKQKGMHNILCSLFSDLGLGKDAVDEVDMIFDDLDNHYDHFKGKGIEIHLFVTKEEINLVIKTGKKNVQQTLRRYFVFPK